MDNLKIFFLSGLVGVAIKKIYFDIFESYGNTISGGAPIDGQNGGSNEIDLTNVSPPIIEDENESKIFSNNKEFSPMYQDIRNSSKVSKTKSSHLVVPGLMPAPASNWDEIEDEKKIFYMPNDTTPHKHGEATHHLGKDGFKLNRAFILNDPINLSDNNFEASKKKLVKYREKLNAFNMGQSNTPIETWIHWKIPSNKSPYPKLKVLKDSIIWWDYNQYHNLKLVSKESYYNNKVDDSNLGVDINDNIVENVNMGMNIVVTIASSPGTYYFMCTIPGHAQDGHKIIIEVI